MLLLARIAAVYVSLAYLAVVATPCAMSEAIVMAAKTGVRETTSGHSQPADPVVAKTLTGHEKHAGHATHTQHSKTDAPAQHEHVANAGPVSQLSAPCLCGCSDSPDSAGNSTARVGFALARAGWARGFEHEPLRHAPALSQPPETPHLASDPVPG